MQTIKVGTKGLLKILRKNRDEHNKVVLEAQENYRKAVIQELDKMLHEARAGKRVRRQVQLAEPVDQTNDYDRVIHMLKMSIEDQVALTEREFAEYVQDKWDWMDQFTRSNWTFSARLREKYGDEGGSQFLSSRLGAYFLAETSFEVSE